MKIILIIFILVILYCLGSAGYFMLSRKHPPETMAKALTWRIAISIALFILLIIGFLMGWVKPHGIS